MDSRAHVIICSTCADTNVAGEAGLGGGARLLAQFEAQLAEHPARARIVLESRRCLMACTAGCVAAVAARGKMQYLLARMPASEALVEQLLDFAALYDAAPTGVAPNHLWPPLMALYFHGRIPPLDPAPGDWSEEGCDL